MIILIGIIILIQVQQHLKIHGVEKEIERVITKCVIMLETVVQHLLQLESIKPPQQYQQLHIMVEVIVVAGKTIII